MVTRYGVYVDGDMICRAYVDIEWNKGFDKDAKRDYVKQLHQGLRESFGEARIEEVTTASDTIGRRLSPYYIGDMENDWHAAKQGDWIKFDNQTWPVSMRRIAYAQMYCMRAKSLINIIRDVDVFTDIFCNPLKDGLTQAEPCAILKLLDVQGNMDIIADQFKFTAWYSKHVRR